MDMSNLDLNFCRVPDQDISSLEQGQFDIRNLTSPINSLPGNKRSFSRCSWADIASVCQTSRFKNSRPWPLNMSNMDQQESMTHISILVLICCTQHVQDNNLFQLDIQTQHNPGTPTSLFKFSSGHVAQILSTPTALCQMFGEYLASTSRTH